MIGGEVREWPIRCDGTVSETRVLERYGRGRAAGIHSFKKNGEVREWPNRAVSKTAVWATGPWVRIPPSPPPRTCLAGAYRTSCEPAPSISGGRKGTFPPTPAAIRSESHFAPGIGAPVVPACNDFHPHEKVSLRDDHYRDGIGRTRGWDSNGGFEGGVPPSGGDTRGLAPSVGVRAETAHATRIPTLSPTPSLLSRRVQSNRGGSLLCLQ